MLLRSSHFAILLVLTDITLASIFNGTIEDVNNKLTDEAIITKLDENTIKNNLDVEALNKQQDVKVVNKKIDVGAINKKLDEDAINKKLGEDVETRRQGRKKDRSTSSSAGEKISSENTGESLQASSSSSSSEQKNIVKDGKPKSSAERTGWRKWHRKCTPCPEMSLKWRDQRIKWICGGYQRARRSFKSLCMMHYRNCQDGTMFTKMFDHRCPEDIPGDTKPHGDHFFYDYKVNIPGQSGNSDGSSGSAESSLSAFG